MEFRPLRRTKNGISEEAAKALLKNEKRGILSVNGDGGYPFAFPVNYDFDEISGKIYFHGAKSGHKVDALKKDDRICFTVFGNEHFTEGEWAPTVQSVVVYGRCRLVEMNDFSLARLRSLAMRYYPNAEEAEKEIAAGMPAVQMYEIRIEHLCGKQIVER